MLKTQLIIFVALENILSERAVFLSTGFYESIRCSLDVGMSYDGVWQ